MGSSAPPSGERAVHEARDPAHASEAAARRTGAARVLLVVEALAARHRVGAPALRVGARADDELRDQPRREELHAYQRRHGGDDEEGVAVHPDAVVELLPEHDPRDHDRGGHQRRPQTAEHVDGLRAVAAQEEDGHQVEHDLHRAAEAVLRRSGAPGAVVDDDLGDARPHVVCQHRDEGVHLAVELQLLGDLAAVDTQRATQVVDRRRGGGTNEPVGHARRDLAQQEPVLAVRAASPATTS